MPRSTPRTSRPDLSRRRSGFTITELLIVIGIIVLLIGILLPALGRVNQRAKVTQTSATMEEFAKACEAFRQEFGFYPHLTGEAMDGPLKGQQLMPIPSVQTSWADWIRAHPESDVLRKETEVRSRIQLRCTRYE